jgi:type I restriction enzyme S subunit
MSSRTKATAKTEEAKPALVPKLRFPEFRMAESWHPYVLEELEELGWVELGRGEVISGQDIKAIPGCYPIYSSSVKNSGLMGTYGRFMFDEELISWSIDGGGDFFHRPTHKFSVTNVSGFMRLKTSHLNYRFLANHLQALHASLTFDYQFKAHPSVIRKLYRLAIPAPAEQQKLAECLSSVDKLIAAQARKVDALKTHKKGLMQQLFPHEGETQPRHRFREFQNVGDWEATTLGQQAKLVRGPFGGSLKKEIFVASGYAVYEQQHAIYSDFSSFRYHITAEKFYELRRFVVAAGDIIMSCSGTMGRFAIVPDGAVPGVINQALLKLTPNGFCSTKFLKEVLELPSVQEKLLSQSAGGAIKNVVSVDQIKALPLRLPGAEEQRAVVGCVSTLDDLITAETQKLDAFKTHKKGLMQQLFPSPEAVEV